MIEKDIELIGDKQPNAITVYIQAFMFTQHVFLVALPDFSSPMMTAGSIEMKDVQVNMSQLPEFLNQYNIPEIHFQGDEATSKRLIQQCEELQKTKYSLNQTRFVYDNLENLQYLNRLQQEGVPQNNDFTNFLNGLNKEQLKQIKELQGNGLLN